MPRFLKNLKITSVDFVGLGANPGAFIRLMKRRKPETPPEGAVVDEATDRTQTLKCPNCSESFTAPDYVRELKGDEAPADLVVECPHCGQLSRVMWRKLPVATPDKEALSAARENVDGPRHRRARAESA